MATDVDKSCPGHRQGSTIDHKKRTKLMFYSGKKSVTFGAIALLLILFVSESMILLYKWTSRQHQFGMRNGSHQCVGGLPLQQLAGSSGSDDSSDLVIISRPTVHEAFRDKITFVVNETTHLPQAGIQEFGHRRDFKTRIEPNRNVIQYGLTLFRDVCTRPDGAIVTVGNSDEELLAQISKVPALHKDWFNTYNCSQPFLECMGFESIESQSLPTNARWVPGTTTHIVPYKENVMHNFADRLWPHIAGSVYPLNESTPHPIDHFLVHRVGTWLYQAGHNMDRNTFMYQVRILGEMTPEADFLAMDGLNAAEDLVCFERFILACTTCDRVSSNLGYNVTKAAVLRYRNAGLRYLGIPEPVVPLPPRRLRVAVYGRRDTKRRRMINAPAVVLHLRNYKNPPLVVTHIDELMATPAYNQSLPEVVSLLSQTDIFITVHGANTWAALFLPQHAAVIEVEGPCGPFSWLDIIVNAVGLKHDQSNPWGRAVASPDTGNTTECKGTYETPDMIVDLQKLDDAIHRLALPTFGSEDRIPHHWLHNWQPHSSS